MSRRILHVTALAGLLAVTAVLGAVTAHAASSGTAALKITPIQRVPFPDRGYVVDLPRNVVLDSSAVIVTENGKPVENVSFTPLAGSGLGFGAVLALDASQSMHGGSFAGALEAARSFIDRRGEGEEIGLLAFNGGVRVLQQPTLSTAPLLHALADPPNLRYGTRIYDALERSLALIARAKLSTAAIVLLTDGTDVGSKTTVKRAIARARAHNVRIFTIGLRSKSYDPHLLRELATETGGAYAEATSPAQLAPIYASLSGRLAREYVLQYRSLAAPKSHVNVQVSVSKFGSSTSSYTAPTPAGLAPYHESFLTRFLLSVWSLLLLAVFVAALIVYIVQGWLKRSRSDLVERMSAFAGGGVGAGARTERGQGRRKQREWRAQTASSAKGALARLGRTLEIADIRMSPSGVVGLTLLGTLLVLLILALLSPILAVLGLLTPLVSRAMVRHKLNKVRADFAEQLPSNLQVLASALRSGFSFSAALATVVEQAQEPSRRELRRVVADDQLGVPLDQALRRVAERMKNRDMEQVALVAELHRTTGGNIAEVLDVVVATIRDRQDVRRLLKTLTAQGRMARWILTSLPIITGLVFYAYQPDVVGPFYAKAVGQVALVIAAIMVTIGSLAIQKIVDIEV